MTRTFQWAVCIALLAPGIAAAAFPGAAQEQQATGVESDIPKVQADGPKMLEAIDQNASEPKAVEQKKTPAPNTLPPLGTGQGGGATETLDAPQVLTTDAASVPCDPCFFMRADYLAWWIRRGPATALLTTGPNDGSALIGEAGTRVLYGQGGINYDTFSGIRLGAGWNFGCDRFWGLEASGFLLESRLSHFSDASDAVGNPLLVRPFLSVVTTQESGVIVANSVSPGQVRGNIDFDSHTHFWGYDVNLVAHSVREANKRLDLLIGYRALVLDEDLDIKEDLTLLEEGASIFQRPPVGYTSSVITPSKDSTIFVQDQFATRNRFYGGQFGGRFQWLWNCWTLDFTAKLALGVTHEEVEIGGISRLIDPKLGIVETPGGVLAVTGQPGTNIGSYSRDRFAVAPEVDLQVHYDLNCHFRASFGYSGLYWSAVARPGDEIDRNVNPKLVPTGIVAGDFDPKSEQTRPTFNFRDNGFWAHGVNFGLEFRY